MEKHLEIKDIIHNLSSVKSRADISQSYGLLLQMQQQLGTNHNDDSAEAADQIMTTHLPSLLHSILRDVVCDDEEIASQALKTLGFVLFYPSLVTDLSDENVRLILKSLEDVITCTKIKAVCNLAVWCISIQQIKDDAISSNIHYLVRAVAHALENPMGSKSVTFEAIQAVIKLFDQVPSIMKSLSHVWCPPIYRKLLSSDKRERDVAERCLQKIKSNILPPLLPLSKTVYKDVKHVLLPQMVKLCQNNGCRVYLIQAWSWFIQLLGEFGLKSKMAVNQMLKVPEETFADSDPQVSIASLIAWEAFIEAVFKHIIVQTDERIWVAAEMISVETPESPQLQLFLKYLKLFMKPLVGILSSRNDVTSRLRCLKTWSYILHKLGQFVNSRPIISVVLEPIFKVIFESGVNEMNVWIWSIALDFLKKLAFVRDGSGQGDLCFDIGAALSANHGQVTLSEIKNNKFYSLAIKWFPRTTCQLEFLLKNVILLWRCQFTNNMTISFECSNSDAALEVFRLILKGINYQLKRKDESSKDEVHLLHLILYFVQGLWKDIGGKTSCDGVRFPSTAIFKFVEAVEDEMHPFFLASSSFKLPLDLSMMSTVKEYYVSDSAETEKLTQAFGIGTAERDVVPAIYLTVIWITVMARISSDVLEEVQLLEKLTKIIHIMSHSDDPFESLQMILNALYEVGLQFSISTKIYVGKDESGRQLEYLPIKSSIVFWLRAWKAVAEVFKTVLENDSCLMFYEGCSAEGRNQPIYNFLLFPFHASAMYSFRMPEGSYIDSKLYKEHGSVHPELNFDRVMEFWVSLYDAARRFLTLKQEPVNLFSEGFCKKVSKLIEDELFFDHQSIEKQNSSQLTEFSKSCYQIKLCGECVAYSLKHADVVPAATLDRDGHKRLKKTSEISSQSRTVRASGSVSKSSSVKYVLSLTARFLIAALSHVGCCSSNSSRVFGSMACFLCRISSQDDIIFILQELSGPLSKWLCACSNFEPASVDRSLTVEIERVWSQLLSCFKRSRPSINFDSESLSLICPLLVPAFQHMHTAIANATIEFWEDTYGNASHISYPNSLVPILSSLSCKTMIRLPGFTAMRGQGPTSEKENMLGNSEKNLDTIQATPFELPNNVNSEHLIKPNNGFLFGERSINHNFHVKNFAGSKSIYKSPAKVEETRFPSNSHWNTGNIVAANATTKDVKSPPEGMNEKITANAETREVQRSPQGREEKEPAESTVAREVSSHLKAKNKRKQTHDDSQDVDFVVIQKPIQRKVYPLTEHQRDVRRAQQGRTMDNMEHGPVLKTYTGVDFSQGNGDSEDPEEFLL